jgi:N-acetylglutamate synthase-like GNAT family acetyltransferase
MDASSTADIEQPVQRQLDAYNARDIDAFMSGWSEDCRYYEFPDRLLARGAAEIRARHLARFQEPNLHGQLIRRIVVANLVVDQEIVTRSFPDGPGEVDVVAIYEIVAGKIANAWFRMGAPRLHAGPAGALRPATAEDAGAIRSLVREAYARWVPVIGREPLPMTADYADAVRNHRIDLLHMGGTLAAAIETVPGDGHLLIVNVAVLPAFQNRGLGRRLLTHAEQLAAAQGHPVVRLFTNKLFAANVQLYRKLGYGVDREERCALGITVYMSKPVRVEG